MPDPIPVTMTSGTLLGLLTERDMTGWELVAEAKNRVGNFWTIQRSQAYRELAQLEKSGLIQGLPEEGRGRRPYRITDQGRVAYLDWIQQSPGGESIRVPFLLTVTFADDIPAQRFAELREEQRRTHQQRLMEYEAAWGALSGATRGDARIATLALGIRYERAALDWLDELPELLGFETVTNEGEGLR